MKMQKEWGVTNITGKFQMTARWTVMDTGANYQKCGKVVELFLAVSKCEYVHASQ